MFRSLRLAFVNIAVSRFNTVMSRNIFLTIFALALAGCDAEIERFDPNQVYSLTVAKTRAVPAAAALADASQVVDRLFGTPDDPAWPSELLADSSPSGDLGLSSDSGLAAIAQLDRLRRAAGPVSSDRKGVDQGLFRKHCVDCHALAGSGAGPASLFQNPYPRDFRHGVFKWKSTERSAKPLRRDLAELLRRGVPSTAMPSFSLLGDEDVEALVDYVIYLSVRGEVERRLVAAAVDDLGYEETPPDDPQLRLVSAVRISADSDDSDSDDSGLADTEASDLIREIVVRVAKSWATAGDQVVPVPTPRQLGTAEVAESVQRGKELFHGPIANCVGCHGPSGNGQAVTLDYDDWAKEYSTRIGLTPTNREAMRPFRDAGALPPRQIKPRNFSRGVLRGGDDPETIYRKITQGIAGTPMPAVQIVPTPQGIGLTSDQAWDLVRFVRSLGKPR